MHVDSKVREYEYVAHMELMGTPQISIASALQLSEGRISQILAEEEYQVVKAQIASKDYLDRKEVRDNWENMELVATRNVLATLKYNKDPDYNLRVAIMANKADKRGHNVTPIQAQQGMRASVNLPTIYVQNIQNNGGNLQVVNHKDAPKKEQNRFNMMTPGKVEELLGKPKVEENMFAGIAFKGAAE